MYISRAGLNEADGPRVVNGPRFSSFFIILPGTERTERGGKEEAQIRSRREKTRGETSSVNDVETRVREDGW